MKEQLNIGGTLVSYYKFGTGKKAIVFLHGWRSDGMVWKNVADSIDQNLFSIYLVDLPGFGSSPKPSTVFTVSDYAKVVAGLIDKLGCEKVIIVGHSFGGRIAIKLSVEYSDLVSRLVLVDSAGIRSPKADNYNRMAKIAKPFFKPKFMQGLRKLIYKRIGSEDYLETSELRETYKNLISEDLSVFLSKIDAPTLVVWGEDDESTPIEDARVIHKKIKDSRLEIVKNAGHFSFLEKPAEFTKLLNEFIE
ncbi:MAG: alpha/beta hydrolase [Patescibacteria group bacterium]|jgi:pimeloyl-ACP methyl ester carboxylesterase